MKTKQIYGTLSIYFYTDSEIKSGFQNRLDEALEEALENFLEKEGVDTDAIHPCLLENLYTEEVEEEDC